MFFSMHTDPFAQPGSGDAGGMNVYIARSVEAMLAADPALRIEVFTLDFGDGAAERSAALSIRGVACTMCRFGNARGHEE